MTLGEFRKQTSNLSDELEMLKEFCDHELKRFSEAEHCFAEKYRNTFYEYFSDKDMQPKSTKQKVLILR